MIFHASIPADDPERVARVLAEIWRCQYFPFVFPESFLLIRGNGHGTILEVVKRGDLQVPAPREVGLNRTSRPLPYNEVHLNIGTDLDAEEIFALAAREGWIARECDRAYFKLIELWVENRFLIELMVPEEQDRYAAFYRDSSGWREAARHVPMPLPQFGYTDEWLTQPSLTG